MKKINHLLVLGILISKLSFSQNCDAMLQFKEGASITLTNYKDEEKITGKIKQSFSKVTKTGAAVSSHIKSETFDKKDKLQSSSEFDMRCEKGAIYMDMKMMVPSQTTEAYEGMDMKLSGNDLEMPPKLNIGQGLNDANMKMEISNKGNRMAVINFTITERKVEAKETITTSAGSFDCFVISYRFNSETTPEGLPFPIKIGGLAKQWFSYEVGAVKTESYRANGKSLGYTLLTEIKNKALKPSIPKGTRDFSPEEVAKRNYIFDTIKNIFQRYCFQQIETPTMENMETLMGKYGEEGDRLIFKILDSGDFFHNVYNELVEPEFKKIGENFQNSTEGIKNNKDLKDPIKNIMLLSNLLLGSIQSVSLNTKLLSKFISQKALRYDLTIPFARYVVQHQNEISFPFKRYQIQPVWRADRPQKGRYREFYQCDADIIGSDSLLNEIDLVQLMDDVFTSLHIPVTIKINNRKILAGIAEVIGENDKIIDITVAIDKLDKIGIEGVNKELKEKNLSPDAIQKLQPLISFQGTTKEKIALLKNLFSNSSIGNKGLEEFEHIFSLVSQTLNLKSQIELDITLARGLNYYTGTIFEVKANEGTLKSSISGGGRYDNLTGVFGLPNISGVGISFGVDRIYDVMDELGLFPDTTISSSTKLLFVNFGNAEEQFILPLLKKLRDEGVYAELYPDQVKIKKQFDYANKRAIPYVAIVGSEEMQSNTITLKNMASGNQEKLSLEKLIKKLNEQNI